MSEILKIVGIGIISSVIAMILRPNKPEMSFVVIITGILIILMYIVDLMGDSLKIINELAVLGGIDSTILKIILKMVGIGYIAEFGAGILVDFGSPSIADKVILAGKLIIFVLSIPIIRQLFSLILEFINLL